jgi:hypothetical protein
MKVLVIKLLFIFLLTSCINRDRPVDKTELTGSDYRLFQETPAWELAKAVQDGNEERIEELINKDPKIINYQEPKYGSTLLILTVMNQQMKSLKILLKNKADVSIHNTYDGASAIIEASSSKYYDTDFAKILLQNGANVNDIQINRKESGKANTPLIRAAKVGAFDLVELLVKNGANINYQNLSKQSALSESAIRDHYKISLYLLQNGADYRRPIFYRPDYSIPYEKQDPAEVGEPIFLVDLLREDLFGLLTFEHRDKMKIVDFLKSKGIDYRASPIPDYIEKSVKEKYPDSWQDYLKRY